MNSFYSIFVYIDGKQFFSRLYGNRIECPDAGVTIYRSDIVRFKYYFFKKKIYLESATQSIFTDYNKFILSWFDPLFFIRWFSLGLFILSPLVLGLYFLRSPAVLIFLIISALMGSAGYFFFKFARPDESNGGLKVFLLNLAVCLPVIYWYPLSGYIFATCAAIILLMYAAYLAYSNALNFRKYYFSISWVLLVLFFYFWVIAGMQVMVVFKNLENSKNYLNWDFNKGQISAESTIWQKPLDWNLSEDRFFFIVLKRQSLLWTFAPFAPQLSIKSDLYPELGWISLVPTSPEVTMKEINNHLDFQINILLSKILSVEKTDPYLIHDSPGIYEQFYYYDMKERKTFKLLAVIVPQVVAGRTGSLVFALKLPESTSSNYYLDLIKEGFKTKG